MGRVKARPFLLAYNDSESFICKMPEYMHLLKIRLDEMSNVKTGVLSGGKKCAILHRVCEQ